jgi:apolipoprotein N-acyltransferase
MALVSAFAPAGLWPIAVLSPLVLITLWHDAPSPREAAILGFLFSAGTYGAGTWWLYNSLHVIGQAPVWLSILLMLLLVAIMAAWQGLLGFVVVRWLPRDAGLANLVAVPSAWLLVEWFRGWFLSGFPWLSLGYSQTESVLRGFAPVGGVYLVSFVLLLGAAGLVTAVLGRGRARIAGLLVCVLPWPLGALLDRVDWTRPVGAPIEVAVLQGAVPQDEKWLSSNLDGTLALYRRLHAAALGARLIVWPESAPPDLANNLPRYLASIWSESRARGSDVVMGVVRVDADGETYFNSMLALSGDEPSFYDKNHLVPFGEYFPVPRFVRQWLRLMSLPYSDFTRGGDGQPALSAGGVKIAPSICYEDAYPTEQLPALAQSNLLVNVTNDAWFGHSGARYQHFQIARMRAIESRRPLLRAANDGLSGLVGPRGRAYAVAPEFEPATLRGIVQPRAGNTPWMLWANVPVVVLAASLAVLGVFVARRRRAVPVIT